MNENLERNNCIAASNYISYSYHAYKAYKEVPDVFRNWHLDCLHHLKTELYFIILIYLGFSKIQGMGKILKLSSIIVQKFCFINVLGLTVKIQINLVTEN